MSINNIPAEFSSGDYSFRRAGRGDGAKIRQWLMADHLIDWWTPSEEELGAVLAQEEGRAAYLVEHDGWPFAYIQLGDASFDTVLAERVDCPKDTVRMDQFVGDAQMIGFGHGVKFIKAFVAAMKETPGVAKLMALPTQDNVFAQRSYTQAGFRAETSLDTPQGKFNVLGQKVD